MLEFFIGDSRFDELWLLSPSSDPTQSLGPYDTLTHQIVRDHWESKGKPFNAVVKIFLLKSWVFPRKKEKPLRSLAIQRYYGSLSPVGLLPCRTRNPCAQKRSSLDMGNDGGSIPTRRELVKQGAKDLTTTQVKEIQSEQQEHFWATCALSHEPLAQPVVSDGLGSLYNKAAVLDHLLANAKANMDLDTLIKQGEGPKDRIRNLRDVVEVKFESEELESTGSARWICPITSKPLGPGTKAVYLVPCGHAFAESVTKEMQGDSCLQCNELYSKDNVITILPTSQGEKDRLEHRLQNLKASGLSHSLKKLSSGSKKRKKAGLSDSEAAVTIAQEGLPLKQTMESIGNAETASLTSKVLAEQGKRNKHRKLHANDNVKALFSSQKAMEGKNTDFMTRGFSIPAGARR